jgi:hypothetical protein
VRRRAAAVTTPTQARPTGPRSALLLLAAVALTSVAPASTAAAGTPPSGADEPLAVVNAGGGSFTETADGYRLTLKNVTERAVWFSDRPERNTGSYSLAELDEVFFGDDEPPNAALEVFAGRGSGTVVIVEISNPRYQPGKDRLLLDARVLAADEIRTATLGDHAERATSDIPARFGPAALFVDDGCSYAGGSVVDLNGVTCAQALEVYNAFIDQDQDCDDVLFVGDDTWGCVIDFPDEYVGEAVYTSDTGKSFTLTI